MTEESIPSKVKPLHEHPIRDRYINSYAEATTEGQETEGSGPDPWEHGRGGFGRGTEPTSTLSPVIGIGDGGLVEWLTTIRRPDFGGKLKPIKPDELGLVDLRGLDDLFPDTRNGGKALVAINTLLKAASIRRRVNVLVEPWDVLTRTVVLVPDNPTWRVINAARWERWQVVTLARRRHRPGKRKPLPVAHPGADLSILRLGQSGRPAEWKVHVAEGGKVSMKRVTVQNPSRLGEAEAVATLVSGDESAATVAIRDGWLTGLLFGEADPVAAVLAIARRDLHEGRRWTREAGWWVGTRQR